MRHEHRAGEKMFPDFAGQSIPVIDARTGVVTEAQIFVGLLGASNYTYAEAFPSQELPHWIAGHVHAFTYFGGAPRVLVCDYMARNIIRLLCPPPLCGRAAPRPPLPKLKGPGAVPNPVT